METVSQSHKVENAQFPSFMDTVMIGVLVFPDFQLLDASGPISVFETAARLLSRRIPITVMSEEADSIRSSAGVELRTQGFDDRITTLFVTGGDGVIAASKRARTIEFVQAVADRGCRVVSVCSGTYILAEAGLLNGRRATTHWRRSRHFSEQFPAVKLEPERVFVQDGHIWTSAGVSAGIDVALAIIADDYGEGLAREVARQLVIYYRRSGGQPQFSELLKLKSPTERFRSLLLWIRQNLNMDLTVDVLAAQANMSQRHFTRAFLSETGETPAKVVERLRLEVASERIRGSSEPIELVASATGFRDPERMRRAFIRVFGHPPRSHRNRQRVSRADS
jgi:transcriptional regulator GlxA family with amidase domain